MTKPQKIVTGAVLGLLVYLYVVNRGHTATVTIDPRSLPGNVYDPFNEWRHDHPTDYYRPWPLVVGPNCLPMIYQSQDKGLALEQGGVPDGSYAQ